MAGEVEGGSTPLPQPHEPAIEIFDSIEFQTAALIRNFEQFRRQASAFAELDRSWYLLLRTLDELGPSEINHLAASLGLDASTVTRQVSAMEAESLVERTAATQDRRRRVVSITNAGTARMAAAAHHRRELTAKLLADWDIAELEQLASVFTRYNQSVRTYFRTRP